MAIFGSVSQASHRALAAAVGAAVVAALSACDLPFSLPTTRALENGAADTLGAARSFELTGAYTESGDRWSIDLQVARPDREHVVVSKTGLKLEAIILGDAAYFRGNDFLSKHMGDDLVSRNLVKAAGNGWWKGSVRDVPRLPDLTDGDAFRTTFLGTAVRQRTDHVSVDGLDAVDLSGPRADVFIDSRPPYRVLRVQMKKGVVIDGISDADLRFANFDKDFGITTPKDVIDFSNLSTLPPIYTVVSVDTARCGSPCAVSALLKNLGGMNGAQAPSTITFTMTDTATRQVLGSCQVKVVPDVGYNGTTAVRCTIGLTTRPTSAARVTATAENPGRA